MAVVMIAMGNPIHLQHPKGSGRDGARDFSACHSVTMNRSRKLVPGPSSLFQRLIPSLVVQTPRRPAVLGKTVEGVCGTLSSMAPR